MSNARLRYRLFEDDSNRKHVRYIAVIENNRKTVETRDFGPNREQARAALRRAEASQSMSFAPPPEVVRAVVQANNEVVPPDGVPPVSAKRKKKGA